mgnify:FL=1
MKIGSVTKRTPWDRSLWCWVSQVVHVEADVGRAQLMPIQMAIVTRRLDEMDQLQYMVALGLPNEYQRPVCARNTGMITLRRRYAVHLPQNVQRKKVSVECDHLV